VGKIFQYKTLVTEFKDIDTTSMTVGGYFSAFDKVDSYNEVAVKGSFKKSLDENRERIKYLLNHDITKNLGPLQDLREDDYGLFYRATVLPTTFGKDFIIMAEGGVIKEHSIGYKEIASRSEGKVKYITEHKLMEGSALTGWGVNQYTPMVPVFKSLIEAQDRIKTLENFVRNTTATDETIHLLMLEIKQLHQLLIDATPAVAETLEPEKVKGLDLQAIAQLFITN
jgi:HK97 family phage prohead protease